MRCVYENKIPGLLLCICHVELTSMTNLLYTFAKQEGRITVKVL